MIQKLGSICIILLACLSVLIDVGYVYYVSTNKDETITTNYIDVVGETEAVEEGDTATYVMEVNYFDNVDGNGEILQEIKWTYYADESLTSIYSTGMQFVGSDYVYDEDFVDTDNNLNQWVNPAFYYYNSYDSVSWESTNLLNRNMPMIVTIDDEIYCIQLDKTMTVTSQFLFWEYNQYTFYYSYAGLFEEIFNSIESNSYGYGDFLIPFDLSKYYTVYKYNTNTQQFIYDDLSDTIFTYVTAKIHYESNGAVNSNQSLYDCIAYNSQYDSTEIGDVDYWSYDYLYTLTIEDFSARYSDAYNGYLLSLESDVASEIRDESNIRLILRIDTAEFDAEDGELVGLDYYALLGIPIDSVQLIGPTSMTWYLLDYALAGIDPADVDCGGNIITTANTYEEVAGDEV